jgi:hypothetical protein
MTKGERLSKKVKTKSTNNEGNIKKRTHRSKTTHRRRQVIGTVLKDRVWDDAHSLQDLLKRSSTS